MKLDGPIFEVGPIQLITVDLYQPQHVTPLAFGNLAASAKPIKFT